MDFHTDIVSELTSYFKLINLHIKDKKISQPILVNLISADNPKEAKRIETRHKSYHLLERLLSFKRKHISSKKRNVLISQDLKKKLNSSEYNKFAPIIEQITLDFQLGNDVNGRLSKRADKLDKDDPMLYEWNMYHLHLGKEKENKWSNYYKRTGNLLIVYIGKNDEKVYFVDISEEHGHNSLAFSRQKYLDILQRNWPHILADFELKEIHLEDKITDEQLLSLRKKNATTINSIDGKTFFNPGIGVTSNGTSIQIIRKTDWLMDELERIESYCRSNQKNFVPKQIPEYLDYKLKFDSKTWSLCIVEYSPGKPPKEIYQIYL